MRYRLTLKHDGGTVRITTTAQSEEAAIRQVMGAELCPRSAIKKVEQV